MDQEGAPVRVLRFSSAIFPHFFFHSQQMEGRADDNNFPAAEHEGGKLFFSLPTSHTHTHTHGAESGSQDTSLAGKREKENKAKPMSPWTSRGRHRTWRERLGCPWGRPLAGRGEARRVLSAKLWLLAQQPRHFVRPGFEKASGCLAQAT